jgi:2-hydroxychromene-2-carboxylate isomerase
MSGEVEYFYTLVSPWTYLGHERLAAICAAAGITIVHKPVDLGAVFQVSGGLPLNRRAVQRQNYRWYELQRWRAYRGRPLNLRPKFFPADANTANRMVIAAQAAGGDATRLAGAFLRAVWAEDRNIADPATMKAIAEENDLDGGALLEAATGNPVVTDYERLTEEAKTREVFGAPTYIYRGEPFWGQDRLEFLERAVTGAAPALSLPPEARA